ncbi:Hypothetical protein R9X50_00369300 [Acrodontium crateriforme]|uniref:Uncharacterized protein n=1 Tax=Acrodontium crateriforme TaxID=150365 RepID=A0AAQ3M4M9_9PEZI|nr:Hypothetical protein R9X50_00369300 [Acrodontium crateriforme]
MSRPLTRTALKTQPCTRLGAPTRGASLQPWLSSPHDKPARRLPPFQCLRLVGQQRGFSVSAPCAAAMPKMKRAAAPSMAVQTKQQRERMARDGGLPDEMGLLNNTLVMPSGKKRPGLFSKERRELEKSRLKLRFQEAITALQYKLGGHGFWSKEAWSWSTPRPQLRILQIPGIAKTLHEEMYRNFAAGDLSPVEKKLCKGLLHSLRARISIRPPGVFLKWKVDRYLETPKLVSYKAIRMPKAKGMPDGPGSGLVQAVVRIRSMQSLQHWKRESVKSRGAGASIREVRVDIRGRELSENTESEDTAKEAVEYVVIQKMMRNGVESDWMVWGMTEETAPSTLTAMLPKPGSGSLPVNSA